MTQDELDLLASAYVDGQASPDEVALVERDPRLRAMVAELRAVDLGFREAPTAPTPLKEAHLAAARLAFEQEIAVRKEGSEAVAAASASHATGGDELGDQVTNPWWRSMPAWLPVAAVLIVVGGGLFASLNQAGSDSASETAEVAVGATDDAADSADSATFSSADTDADADDMEMFDSAASDMADTEDAESDLAEDAIAESDGESNGESNEESIEMETQAAPVDPIMFDEVPTSLDGIVLPELSDPLDSPCFEVVAEEPVVIDGFVEAFLGQEPVELWIIERSVDFETRPLLVDADCLILRP